MFPMKTIFTRTWKAGANAAQRIFNLHGYLASGCDDQRLWRLQLRFERLQNAHGKDQRFTGARFGLYQQIYKV